MPATNTAPVIPYRTRAAFLINNRWCWHTWTHSDGNKHAAIIDKSKELGATCHDFGNADHGELSRWNTATRG